ncbi:MAG: hypothetical protein GWP50_04730 [Proteobacteria bacterium]|nr:hypothetical protein [Pseudomonadota bacterium]
MVDSFDPKAMSALVTAEQVSQWLALAKRCTVDREGDAVIVEAVDSALAASMLVAGWDAVCAELENAELVTLIRLFTLGEMQHPSWQAGAKSPVVPLVKLLKQRNAFDAALGRWIKANTTNRFLPHGDLSALL